MPLGFHILVFIAYRDHITLQSLSDKEMIQGFFFLKILLIGG